MWSSFSWGRGGGKNFENNIFVVNLFMVFVYFVVLVSYIYSGKYDFGPQLHFNIFYKLSSFFYDDIGTSKFNNTK